MANFSAKCGFEYSEVSVNTPGGTITGDSNERFSASDLLTDSYFSVQSAKGGMRITLPTGSPVTAAFVTSGSKEPLEKYCGEANLPSGAKAHVDLIAFAAPFDCAQGRLLKSCPVTKPQSC
jgi:hypothetical protein